MDACKAPRGRRMILDAQQQSAVKTDTRRALVIAGPGSGKTRCIVERAAFLIEERQVSPYEICIVTFTRKAAGEIKARLKERIGNQAYRMTIGTFHATALAMLHRFGDLIGYRKNNSTVYGDFEEQFLLKEVARDMGIYNGKTWKVPKKEIDAVFAKYYQEGAEPLEENPAHDLFMAFIQRCRENNSYTYGSLLTGFKLLLPSIHQYLQWKHVIIDESHDTDLLQWNIIREIEKLRSASLYVVADLDQTIYEWRGAFPEYLLQHQSEFDVFKLENNYRSAPEIVEAAKRLIENNQSRISKTMNSTRENDGEALSVRYNTDSAGIVSLVGNMESFHAGCLPVAVLARNHILLQKIDSLMEAGDVQHKYIGKTTALTNSESFRRFHAFLKLTVNHLDNFSFLLIKDLIGISREEYLRIRVKAAEEDKSHFQAWDWDNKDWDFFEWASIYRAESETAALAAAMRRLNGTFPDLSPESLAFIEDYLKDHPVSTITDYLSWLATYDISDEIKESESGITLMTIHAAKGLEWPCVIVAGCNEGTIPSKQSASNDGIEAERRLFYVAMTRAQDHLILTVRPETSESNGRVYESPKSRFIGEIQPCT